MNASKVVSFLFLLNMASVQADETTKSNDKQGISYAVHDLRQGKIAVDASLFSGNIPAFITYKSKTANLKKENIGLTVSPTSKNISSNPRSQFLSEVNIDFVEGTGEGAFSGVIGSKYRDTNIAGTVIYQERNRSGVWQCYIDGSNAKKWSSDYLIAGCKEGVPPSRISIVNINKQISQAVADLAKGRTPVDASLFSGYIPAFITYKPKTANLKKKNIELTISPTSKKTSTNPRSLFLSEVSVDFKLETGQGSLMGIMSDYKNTGIAGTVIYHVRSRSGFWQCYIDGSKAKGWSSTFLPEACKEGPPQPLVSIKNIEVMKTDIHHAVRDLRDGEIAVDVSLFSGYVPAFITYKSDTANYKTQDIKLTKSPTSHKTSNNPRSRFFSEVSIDFVEGKNKGGIIGIIGGKYKDTNIAGTIIYLARSSKGAWQCHIDGSNVDGWKKDYLPKGCKDMY